MAGLSVSMITEHGGHRLIVGSEDRRIETPPIEHLLFYAGLGVMVAIDLVPWPVGLALAVGHVLIEITGRPGLEQLGEALGEA
jgi:hypothetical protein